MTQIEQAGNHTPAKPTLYPYQREVRSQVYDAIREGRKRILIFAPTGAGKTVISGQIVADAVSKGRRVLFIVDLDVLIPQTWQKFRQFGLECGFIKAGWQENRDSLIQIASAQTLPRRSWWHTYNPDIVVLDECHKTAWKTVTKKMMDETYPNAWYLGLTATPWRLSKKEGMGDIFEHLVSAPMPWQLMDSGFLVRPVCYGIKGANLDKVSTIAGDFAEADLSVVCDVPEVVERIVLEWQRLCQGRRTICFAVNIAHSKSIAQAFQDAGIAAEHVDGSYTSKQRESIYKRLETGETSVLSSCGVLQEGFDVPSVAAILLCRPTKSRALYFQQIGRGLRTSSSTGKTDCLVLDQAGNVKRFGFIESLQAVHLSVGEEEEPGEAPVKTCPECSRIVPLSTRICPECGHEFEFVEKEKRKPLEELVLLLPPDEKAKYKWFRKQVVLGHKRGYSPNWAAVTYREQYGVYPPGDWRRHCIYGLEPTIDNKAEYRAYLENHALKAGKDSDWVSMHMRFEFGRDA